MNLAPQHYGILAKWVKEISLGILITLVIQKLLAGSFLFGADVIVALVISFIGYSFATYLLSLSA